MNTYKLTQTGPETQDILDEVNVLRTDVDANTEDIEQLQELYEAFINGGVVIIKPTDTWPVANPTQTAIYRVIDRENTPPEYYADYMWNGTSFVKMAQYDNNIDDEPTADSDNLVRSGGVFNYVATNGSAFDISVANASGGVPAGYADLADALGTNGANVPSAVRKGGMSVKFIQQTPASYSVVVTPGAAEAPTGGVLLDAAPEITSGSHTASDLTELSTKSALPTSVGGTKTYYFAVTGDTTTYTTLVVTLVQSGDNKYVQWRYLLSDVSTATNFTNVENWQGVDDTLTIGSQNLIESGCVEYSLNKKIGAPIGSEYALSWLGSGVAINSVTGVIQEQTDRNTTEKIPFVYGKIKSTTSTKFNVFYYSSKGEYLGYDGWITDTEYTIVFPNNTAYYRIVVNTTVVTDLSVITVVANSDGIWKGIKEIQDDVTQLDNSVTQLENGVAQLDNSVEQLDNSVTHIGTYSFNDVVTLQWLDGNKGINGNDGSIADAANRRTSFPIPVSFDVVISSADTKFLLAYYGFEDQYLGSTSFASVREYHLSNLPDNIAYYRIIIDTSVVAVGNISISSTHGSARKQVADISNQLPLHESALNNGNYIIKWLGIGISIDSNTGKISITNNKNRCASELIPLSMTHIVIDNTENHGYYIYYYQNDGSFLGAESVGDVRLYNPKSSALYRNNGYFRLLQRNNVSMLPGIYVKTSSSTFLTENIIVVDINGNGDYTNVVDALNNANDTADRHVTIYIKQGVYIMPPAIISNVKAYEINNRNLTLIGENKNSTVLRGNIGFYDGTIGTDCATLHLNGNVVIKNMTIQSYSTEFDNYVNTEGFVPRDDYRKAAYCIHRDGQNAEGTKFMVEDCILENDHMTCIGFGLKKNTELIIKDCYCCAEQAAEHSRFNNYGTIYGHSEAYRKGLGQNLSIIRCQIVNKTSYQAINVMNASPQDATAQDTFCNFKLIGNAANTTDIPNSLVISDTLKTTLGKIDELSFGNVFAVS